jgi:hypothetical protein
VAKVSDYVRHPRMLYVERDFLTARQDSGELYCTVHLSRIIPPKKSRQPVDDIFFSDLDHCDHPDQA